ncbi:MAG: DMT family transporter [Paracoccaceae bacterium]
MALLLGLCAAFSWAFHDLLVRQISQSTPILPMLFLVMLSGTAFLFVPAVQSATWIELTRQDAAVACFSGATFALASLSLYAAFSIGPVRLVAPIIGAYPVLSMAWAAINGAEISGLQWGAVLIVVMGIAMVAAFSTPTESVNGRNRAILYAALAGIGFAATFAASQAATGNGAEMPVIFVSRASATITVGILLIVLLRPPKVPRAILTRLVAMGFLDASALALVTLSGTLPHPQLAAVSASLFGMLTIILARIILREPMNGLQWMAAAIVFCGIGVLGFN